MCSLEWEPYAPTVDPRPITPTVGPQGSRYHAPTPRHAGTSVPAYDKPYGSTDPGMRESSRIPKPK